MFGVVRLWKEIIGVRMIKLTLFVVADAINY